MVNEATLDQLGLLLDFVGALVLASDFLGTSRLQKVDRRLRRTIATLSSLEGLSKAVLPPSAKNWVEKVQIGVFISLAALLLIIIEALAFRIPILREWLTRSAELAGRFPPEILGGTMAFSALVLGALAWSRRKRREFRPLVAMVAVILAQLSALYFPFAIFSAIAVFGTLFLMMLLMAIFVSPLYLGYLLERRFGLPSGVRTTAILLLATGFLLQYLATL